MLPRHLQKRKPNPNKKLTDEKKDKLPDLATLVRPDVALQGGYPPQMYSAAVTPMMPAATPGNT